MKVAIGSEATAYFLKEEVKKELFRCGYEVLDLGPENEKDSVLYPEAGRRMGQCIQEKRADRGIILCGTGAGVSIVVNRFQGVYCVACESVFTAGRIPVVNNANVLALGSNVVGSQNALEMVHAYLDHSFCQDCDEARTEFLHGLFEQMTGVEAEQHRGKL